MPRINLIYREVPSRDVVRRFFYVLAQLNYGGMWYFLEMMVDSGSSVSILTDRDALRVFGGVGRVLEPAKRSLVGIGGYADTYVARDVVLKLVDAFDQRVSVTFRLSRLYVVTHLRRFRGREFRDAVFQIPSLLGSDVLQYARVNLDYVAKRGWLEFERDIYEV